MYTYGFGVDIGGTTIKIGLFNLQGHLLRKTEILTRIENEGDRILADVADTINTIIDEESINRDSIQGIGVGVPGPVDKDGNVIGCVNLGWKTRNVRRELSEKTGFNVCVENDANVAGLGEMWQGAARGHKNAVVITLGTGIGGAVIVNGAIAEGAHGASGECGHIHVSDDERESCGCGNRGCLEQYVSANGIVLLAKRKMQGDHKETALNAYSDLSSKHIYDEAKNGDGFANEIIEEAHRLLGKHIATICCVLDPEIIIIGGGLSRAGDILLVGIQYQFKKYAFKACIDTPIRLAKLGNDAGIYGGAKLLFDKV